MTAFDANSNISFLGCGMALWIGRQISGPEGLFYSDKETLEGKGAKVFLETKVSRIDFEKKTVYAMDKEGEEIEANYDKLILATGSLPIPVSYTHLDRHTLESDRNSDPGEKARERIRRPA